MKEHTDEWFAERIKESDSGRVLIPTYLLYMYRTREGDYKSSNEVTHSKLIALYNRVLGQT